MLLVFVKNFTKRQKIRSIPPIFHNKKYIVDFKKKSEIFNTFFANQWFIIPNKSVLPSQLTCRHNFSKKDILQIIRNSNRAHDHGMISVGMLKVCDDSIYKPLELIFKMRLRNGIFPLELKKANVVPIHKKGDKQAIKNYRPVSLLPICEKIFERLLYYSMFDFFSKNNLLSPNQSGFRPGDSCNNQTMKS